MGEEIKEVEEQKERKRVQEIALAYYSRKDVQQAIYDFCKNRETIPRYLEGFGKRPDMLDFPSDIFNNVKKGATSFHCSEEIWYDPLKIVTGMRSEELDELRSGWDFLIDIDSKYLDYSKIAAELMVQALEYHGVKNIGIKFSGSKGMHIIIPWKAFPEELNGEKTKDKFPEWPRLIAAYLQEMIHDKLNERIFQISSKSDLQKKGKDIFELKCLKCDGNAVERTISVYKCKQCKSQMQSMRSNRQKLRCASCTGDMDRISEEEILACDRCKITSQKNPEMFVKKATTKGLIDSVDVVLVAPRHLFRCPYSLHEKTARASIVIEKEEIKDFNPLQAEHLKIKIKNFYPDCKEGEAKELLLQAIDWQKRKKTSNNTNFSTTGSFDSEKSNIDIKSLKITEDMFPDCIKKILLGIKDDGRKRALFVLLAFLGSLNFDREFIKQKVEEWNKKNKKPLPDSYIQGQLSWNERNKIMPPNCGSHYYKELGLKCDCGVKNPISFVIKKALRGTNNYGNRGKREQQRG